MSRLLTFLLFFQVLSAATPKVVLIDADDLRFTSAYATSATCTPSRHGLLTGNYPWRKKGNRIFEGDEPLIIQPGSVTLPSVLQKAGYRTGVVASGTSAPIPNTATPLLTGSAASATCRAARRRSGKTKNSTIKSARSSRNWSSSSCWKTPS